MTSEEIQEIRRSLEDCGCTTFCETWGCSNVSKLLAEIDRLNRRGDCQACADGLPCERD
jgi:hypothetical protein